MFCGVSSFSSVEDDCPWSPRSSPRKSRRRDKNPYSNRGLDKFAAVVADLEAKKEKIMEKVGNPDVVMVRFTHSPSHGWVPIVVKVGDSKLGKKSMVGRGEDRNPKEEKKSPAGVSVAKEVVPVSDIRMRKSSSWNGRKDGWRISYYWPVVLILILVCLVMFGRSFAILCTSVWWYLVPTIRRGDVNTRRGFKEHGRRLDEKLGGDFKTRQLKIGRMEAATSPPRHHHHHVHGRK